MPTYECCRCKKEFRYWKSYENHMRVYSCRPAPGTLAFNKMFRRDGESSLPEQKLTTAFDGLAAKVERLVLKHTADSLQIEAQARQIKKLTHDLGNVKRSLFYVKQKQKAANDSLLKRDAALKKEARKLETDRFMCSLREMSLQQKVTKTV